MPALNEVASAATLISSIPLSSGCFVSASMYDTYTVFSALRTSTLTESPLNAISPVTQSSYPAGTFFRMPALNEVASAATLTSSIPLSSGCFVSASMYDTNIVFSALRTSTLTESPLNAISPVTQSSYPFGIFFRRVALKFPASFFTSIVSIAFEIGVPFSSIYDT